MKTVLAILTFFIMMFALLNLTSGFDLIADLLPQTMIIVGVFVGLGILAGTGGAGSLAYILTATGVIVAIIVFVTGSLGYFGAIPFEFWFIFDTLIIIMGIYLVVKITRG